MNPEPKKYDDDDGRVICNMDVEGMRWNDQRSQREKLASILPNPQSEQLSGSEARQYTWHAILAGLTVVLVFSLTWVLFVLFCTQIWFR